jgi:two-component sensor histidine kinase
MKGKDRDMGGNPSDGGLRSTMTLGRRLSLLVGIALTPPLLLTFHNVVRSQIVLENQARDEVLSAVRQVSNKLKQIIEDGQLLMAVMSKHPAVADNEAACAAYFKSVIAEVPIYRNAAIIATDGKTHCSTVPITDNLDLRDSIHARDRSFMDLLINSTLVQGEGEAPSIAVSRPLTAADGSSKGVIVLILNPERLALELDLEGRPWKSRDRILVLDGQGSLVLTIPRDQVQKAKVIARGISPGLASLPVGVIATKGLEGRPEIVGFASVPNAPLRLFAAVAIDQEMAFAETKYINARSLVLAAITAVFAIGCTWLATHFLINLPIRAIVDTARRREAGDIAAPFPRFSLSTEFGQMSTALSGMSTRINELLEQKTLLLRELQHRVMNSLTLLSSVLEIQRRQVTDATAREHLGRARDRVVAIGTIYRHLYQTDSPNEVEFSLFLNTICKESQNAYAGALKPTITVEADTLEIPGSTAIALAIVTHELITNALKHAYPEGRPGPLTVKLRRSGDGVVDLRVADQGRGLPEDFQIEQSASLGMKVVATTVAQLGGTIEINRLEPGTEFVIHLPCEVLSPKRQ